MKRFFRGMMAVLLLVATFIPFVNVNAEGSSRVQIIMNENAGNNHGTYTVSGGSFDSSISRNSPVAEFVDMGTSITLTVTPDEWNIFVGWYNCEEYDVSGDANHGIMSWRTVGNVLSTNKTYTFTATAGYYNIMPVFESKFGHNNIWITGNGQIAVLYENRDVSEQPTLDGEHWQDNGFVVDYTKGDEITLKAKDNSTNRFVGWFITDRGASDPANYVREPVISTNKTFTYKPGITTIEVDGVEEPLNYITAVFEEAGSVITRSAIDEYIVTKTETEEVSANTDLNDYVNSKKWNITTEGTDKNNTWLALFGEKDGVYKYPKPGEITYVFFGQSYEFEGSNTIVVNHYNVQYTEVTVAKANSGEEPEPTISYEIQRGDGQTFTLTDTNDIEIKASGELTKLTGIKVDGTLIDSNNYILTEGSTILTLKNAYLKTLSAGIHTITFVYNDGSVDATLTVANGNNNSPTPTSNPTTNDTDNPQTGDNIMFYISMLGLSIIGLAGAGIYLKKKRFN